MVSNGEPQTMYERVYWAAAEALDEILGPDEEDGTGEGLVQEIWLVAQQRDEARAEVESLRRQVAELDAEINRLANAIMAIPGEPASEGSAVDVAIRLIGESLTRNASGGAFAKDAAERDVIEAAKGWRAMRRGSPTRPKPESAALIAAVDALSQPADTENTGGA